MLSYTKVMRREFKHNTPKSPNHKGREQEKNKATERSYKTARKQLTKQQ